MSQHFVDQGLVTSRDQSLLKPGELTRADDCYYKPGDPAPFAVQSRTLYNSTPEAATIIGVRFLGFDTASDIIVAHTAAGGGVYRRGPATATGAFVDLQTGVGVGTRLGLDSIYYNGTHTLFNGSARGVVVDSTYATRFLGMFPNTTFPTVNTATGAGPGFTMTATYVMTYWIEERVKVGGVIQRRNITPSAAQCSTFISLNSATVLKPRISKPATVNADATHWAVYATAAMAPPASGSGGITGQGFPIGAEVGEAAIGTAFIDDLRTGANPGLPNGPIYETMAVSIAGTYFIVPRNAAPPIADTGDILEESFILNDITDRSLVRYSWAETPDAFPSLNFIKFSEKEQNEVRVIRTVGLSTVVLLRDSAWRIDYLPRPEDAEFNRGRCRAQIPGAPGVVNNVNAATVFSLGERYFLAYVSPAGVVMTDGVTQNILTEDIDWPATVNLAVLDKATLIDNPDLFRLEVRYPSNGSSTVDKVLFIHYHPFHLKPGSTGPRGKVSGPIARPSTAAVTALISDQQGIYSAQGTSLYVDWNTFAATDPATGAAISMILRSGDLYLAGLGKQARIQRVWIHHNAGAGTITGHILSKREGQADEDHTWSVSMSRREASSWYVNPFGEAFVFGMDMTSPTVEQKINYFVLEPEEEGDAKN